MFIFELRVSVGGLLYTGHLSGCPGYLCVTITEWPTGRLLVRHDTLVFCPSDFHLTFHVPNAADRLRDVPDFDGGTDSSSSTFSSSASYDDEQRRDLVYECLLDDAKVVHRLLLLIPPSSIPSRPNSNPIESLDDDGGVFPTSLDDMHAKTALVMIVMATVGVSLRLCVCDGGSGGFCCWCFPIRRKNPKAKTPTTRNGRSKICRDWSAHVQYCQASNGSRHNFPSVAELQLSPSSSLPPHPAVAASRFRFRSALYFRRRLIVVAYVVWKLVYSVGVTLTVLSTAARIVVRRQSAVVASDDVIDNVGPGSGSRCTPSAGRQLAVDGLEAELEEEFANQVGSCRAVMSECTVYGRPC